MVPDESVLFDRLTGGEFLEFVGRMYGLERGVAARARRANCWRLFELDGGPRKLIAEYSKGMRKRACHGRRAHPPPGPASCSTSLSRAWTPWARA